MVKGKGLDFMGDKRKVCREAPNRLYPRFIPVREDIPGRGRSWRQELNGTKLSTRSDSLTIPVFFTERT